MTLSGSPIKYSRNVPELLRASCWCGAAEEIGSPGRAHEEKSPVRTPRFFGNCRLRHCRNDMFRRMGRAGAARSRAHAQSEGIAVVQLFRLEAILGAAFVTHINVRRINRAQSSRAPLIKSA